MSPSRPGLTVLTLALLLILAGCGFDAPKPALTPPRPAPPPPLSTLSVTLTIPQSEIARAVNGRTEDRIADFKDQEVKCPFGRCRLDVTALRTGPAAIFAEDGQLAIRIPFKVDAALRAQGFLAFAKAEGDAQGLAEARTPLSIAPDWTLHSHLNGTVALGNAHLRVGPLVTNVKELWDESGQTLAQPLWRMLDGQIARIELRPQVEALWKRAFVPIPVSRKPLSWLVLRPEQIGVTQPQIGDGTVTFSLTLAARGEVLVQDQAPDNPAGPLPDGKPLTQSSDQFAIAIPFLLPYGEAERLALSSLQSNPPRVAGMRLAFSELHILPAADEVVVETRFCADPDWDMTGWLASCGRVYLHGIPQFDSATKILRVRSLHYDVASANVMLEALRALAPASLAKTIERHLVFDESRQIRRMQEEVTAQLALPHGKNLAVSATVESFSPPSFAWSREGFLALFSAKGKIAAMFRL